MLFTIPLLLVDVDDDDSTGMLFDDNDIEDDDNDVDILDVGNVSDNFDDNSSLLIISKSFFKFFPSIKLLLLEHFAAVSFDDWVSVEWLFSLAWK